MEKMFSYIFGSLKLADEAIYDIGRELKHQSKVNRRFLMLSLAIAGYIYINDKRYTEEREELEDRLNYQSKMIDKLNNDIRELNIKKGEHTM